MPDFETKIVDWSSFRDDVRLEGFSNGRQRDGENSGSRRARARARDTRTEFVYIRGGENVTRNDEKTADVRRRGMTARLTKVVVVRSRGRK